MNKLPSFDTLSEVDAYISPENKGDNPNEEGCNEKKCAPPAEEEESKS